MAGFVGTSNLLTGEAAEQLLGMRGLFTVRPEKIRLDDPATRPSPTTRSAAAGTIRDVVYLGPDTRYIVDLDAGADARGRPQQNLATSSSEALAAAGSTASAS